MYKFVTICMAAFFAAPFLSSAQSVDVSLSKKFSLKDLDICHVNGPTYRLGDYFYSIEIDWKGLQFAYTAKLDKIRYGIILHRYDQQMQELKVVNFHGKEKEFGPFVPRCIFFHGQLLIFYYAVVDQSIELSMSIVDPVTLEETGHKDLYSIVERNGGLFKMMDAVRNNRLMLSFSPDSSRLLVVQAGNTDEVFACVVNGGLEVEHPMKSRVRQGLEDIGVNDIAVDNGGCRYISYSYKADRLAKSGVLFQKEGAKDVWMDIKLEQNVESVDKPRFIFSKDGAILYLYAVSIEEEVGAGYELAKINTGEQKIGDVSYFRFPAETGAWLHKEGFRRGSAGDKNDYYDTAVLLKDGSVVLSGYPLHLEYTPYSKMRKYVESAGPIINAFVKGGNASFGVVYRIQENSEAAGFVAVPMDGKLAILYNDGEKNVLSTEPTGNRKTYSPRELVLAEAVIASDGNLIGKSKISVKDADGTFYLSLAQRMSDMQLLVPVGEETNNMSRYYLLTKQWANVDLR